MAEQDDASTVGNIELAIQQALLDARTVTVGKVIAFREVGANKAPVVDVQIGPKRVARPVDGKLSEAVDFPIKRNIPVAFFQCGGFTIKTKVRPGDHVLLIICDRDVDTWMQGKGETYRPAMAGVVHDINDSVAFPFLTPESFQPGVRPTVSELFIGDQTGEVCSIVLDSALGKVTVKGAATVNVEAPVVTLGSAGTVAPIARIGDQVIIPTGSSAGTYPITAGIAFGIVPSAHKVKG